jgi:hypothetical protein
MNPLSVAVATHGLGRRVASEAEPLEGSLQDEFSRGLHRARVEAIVDLLGYCDQLVTFVEQELTRLGDDVLEDIAAAVRHECAAMRPGWHGRCRSRSASMPSCSAFMATTQKPGRRSGVVIVEDGATMGRTLIDRLVALRGPAGERVWIAEWLDHDRTLAWCGWRGVDVVFVDAYFSDRQRHDPPASLFAGLEVAEMLSARQVKPRVVAYSGLVRRPEINIPFREPAAVGGRVRPAGPGREPRDDRVGRCPSGPGAASHRSGLRGARRLP